MTAYKTGDDFSQFIIPDADFEQRVQNIWRQEEPKVKPTSIFDGFVVDPDIFDQNMEAVKTRVEWLICKNVVANDPKNSESPNNWLTSELEKKFSFYTDKFQRLLQMDSVVSLEWLVQRYARILLYILEQFQISWNRKEQIKLMVKLKRVLWEIHAWEDEFVYNTFISNKTSLIRTSWELQEEIELLYHMYFQNYVYFQKEAHKQEKERRENIIQTIETIEHSMLWKEYKDTSYWWEKNPDIARLIEDKRNQMRQRVAQLQNKV